nr:uncharacterized protein LOC110362310 isoform X12 [Columba livia]
MGSACDGRRWNCARGTREEDFAAGLRSHLRLFPNPGKTAAMSIFGFVLVFGGISSASSNGKACFQRIHLKGRSVPVASGGARAAPREKSWSCTMVASSATSRHPWNAWASYRDCTRCG